MELQKQEQALIQLHSLLADSLKGYQEATTKAKGKELKTLLTKL